MILLLASSPPPKRPDLVLFRAEIALLITCVDEEGKDGLALGHT